MPQREHYNQVTYDERDAYQIEQLGFMMPADAATDQGAIDLAMHVSAEAARLDEGNKPDGSYGATQDRAERAGRMAKEIFQLFPPSYRVFLMLKSAEAMKSDEEPR